MRPTTNLNAVFKHGGTSTDIVVAVCAVSLACPKGRDIRRRSLRAQSQMQLAKLHNRAHPIRTFNQINSAVKEELLTELEAFTCTAKQTFPQFREPTPTGTTARPL